MRDYLRRPAVFIATLGNAPQVVTLALDHLLSQRSFVEVCVIHTEDTPGSQQPQMKFDTMYETVQVLDAEFLHPKLVETFPFEQAWRVDYPTPDRYYQFTYRRVIIHDLVQNPGELATAVAVYDVETEENSRAAFRTIYQLVKRYKEQRAIIQFCIAGGRKSMSVFGMAAAQLLFTPGDKLWQLVSPYSFMNSRAMHDKDGVTHLINIPFISISTVNPVLGSLMSSSDPYDIVQAQENYLHLMDLTRKESFLRELNFDEYQILVGIAQGLGNEEIGRRLKKELAGKTVANKLTVVYEAYIFFISNVPADITKLTRENMRAFLAAEFGAYFQQRGERLD